MALGALFPVAVLPNASRQFPEMLLLMTAVALTLLASVIPLRFDRHVVHFNTVAFSCGNSRRRWNSNLRPRTSQQKLPPTAE
jgi:hypothetical protein